MPTTSRDVSGLPILRPPRRKSHAERLLQEAMISFYGVAAQPLQALLFAVPNGEARDPVTAGILVGISAERREQLASIGDEEALRPYGQGVLPGAPDLMLLLAGGRSVPIEVKIETGRVSKPQRRFHAAAGALGHIVRVVRSLEEWADLLEEVGIRLRSRPFGPGITPRLPRP